jgi:hypothetical protein
MGATMRDTMIIDVNTVLRIAATCKVQAAGHWVPARPEGFASWRYRVKAAWMVFTGKADALVWPVGQ